MGDLELPFLISQTLRYVDWLYCRLSLCELFERLDYGNASFPPFKVQTEMKSVIAYWKSELGINGILITNSTNILGEMADPLTEILSSGIDGWFFAFFLRLLATLGYCLRLIYVTKKSTTDKDYIGVYKCFFTPPGKLKYAQLEPTFVNSTKLAYFRNTT